MESVLKIRKRNGVDIDFNPDKIIHAVQKANLSVAVSERIPDKDITDIANNIMEEYKASNTMPNVESVQDKVITQLMQKGYFRLAINYTTYRYQHELSRKSNSIDDKVMTIVDGENIEAKEENANKDPEIIPTQRDYIAGEVSRDITRRKLLPPDIMLAHDDGKIHFHDSDYFAQHSNNCFRATQKFVTDKGLRSFMSFKDGEKVRVKDKDGIFREATVRYHGKQKMQVVTFKTNKTEYQVVCTPDHRWLLEDGSVTTELKVGDKLYHTQDSTKYSIDNAEDAMAFCVGFAVGDGTDAVYKDTRSSSTVVRLCGNKVKYKDIFELAGFRISPMKDSKDLVARYIPGFKQNFINGKAWRYMTLRQKALAFHGFYAADGATKSHNITTADARLCLFIEETSALAGYYISSTNSITHDTPYKKDAWLIYYQFIISQPVNIHWRVDKIEKFRHGEEYDAWCVEEPVTHSFTLENGMVTGNCELVNLDDQLQNGTMITDTLIEKPHRFSTACNIGTQIISQVASSTYGGQTISLCHLAKFVDVSRKAIRKEIILEDKAAGIERSHDQLDIAVRIRLRKEVKAGVQTIQYQVLTLMTTNGQTPFITMYLDLSEAGDDKVLKDDLAMCIEEVLYQRIEGVKNEKGIWITPAFPKLIYMLTDENVYEDSPYFYLTELAAKCTAKRMVPDYISSKIMKKFKGDTYPCMGCRSFLTPDRFSDKIGNVANAKNYEEGSHKYYGRFNQGVVTINLPYVAMESSGNLDEFWKDFEDTLELCHRALRIRHERLLGTKSDVAPILWQYGAIARLEKGETIDKLLYNGYSTISLGYAGLYEAVKYLTGYSHTDPKGKELAIAIMQKMNDKCAEWKAAENIDYSLYGTPLESTTYKFAKALKKKFGVVKDVSDHDYITNSYHVNVREEIDAFKKLEFEAEFQQLSPGGAISYVEVPNMQNNIPAVISLIQFIYENILYAELNTKSDYCQECGYDGEIKIVEDGNKLVWECPNCGNRDQTKMNVARRTCGYIGTQFWNQGRTAEIKDRVMHL